MYWYLDNWTGSKNTFKTLKEAKISAKNETGLSIAIYSKKTGLLVCSVEASGFCPS